MSGSMGRLMSNHLKSNKFWSYQDNSIMDILDIFGHFYLNHLSPLWGYFFSMEIAKKCFFVLYFSKKVLYFAVFYAKLEHDPCYRVGFPIQGTSPTRGCCARCLTVWCLFVYFAVVYRVGVPVRGTSPTRCGRARCLTVWCLFVYFVVVYRVGVPVRGTSPTRGCCARCLTVWCLFFYFVVVYRVGVPVWGTSSARSRRSRCYIHQPEVQPSTQLREHQVLQRKADSQKGMDSFYIITLRIKWGFLASLLS